MEIASDLQASNITLLDVRESCNFADYFVICSGESPRQVSAIVEEIERSLKKDGVRPSHVEGKVDSGWVLIDFGGVIVHVFTAPERDYYRLDELWHEAKPVVRIQ